MSRFRPKRFKNIKALLRDKEESMRAFNRNANDQRARKVHFPPFF